MANPPDDSLGEYIRGSSSGDTGSIWSRQGAQFYKPPGAVDPVRKPPKPPKAPEIVKPYVPLPKEVRERNYAIEAKVQGFFGPVLTPIQFVHKYLIVFTLGGAALGVAGIFLATTVRFDTDLLTAAAGAGAGALTFLALFWAVALTIGFVVESISMTWIMMPDLLRLIFWLLVTAALFVGGIWLLIIALSA